MRLLLYCIACLMCFGSVLAQGTIPESPVKIAADRFLAMTQADYYPNLIKQKTRISHVNACDESSCSGTGLPVTLIKFEGERIDDATVSLSWQTSEEINNDYFELERTLNPSWGFETVAKVKGAGSIASLQSYHHIDFHQYAGYTYYRLKQVDFDGTYQYSAIISIKGSSALLSVTALPNPGQGKTIAFKIDGLKESEKFTSVIYDARGAIIYSDIDLRTISERQIIKPTLKDISPGKYTIKVKSANRQATFSFVVIP
ncbi:T9SS type A sorting domain-containing protein [Dyadobacter sp. CY326]|uniref:T9SS type A sorting domain-containing protein n=1 Tax=Dyadobacter sp. CY326 TaxID=2907300 RepID=UPI001F3556C2|nr:T9SS type A sorting domain-containing protein [Dyadobacter sp. CY326]MCE7067180.1 T9SS type A sorting domain-containing protein [Dyadobacter sp. CY326]